MNETPPADEELSLEQRRYLDEICDRFEAACKAGSPPAIEDHLPTGSYPPAFIRELILLDLYYRRRRGELPLTAEYSRRFPQLAQQWLAKVCEDAEQRTTLHGAAPETETV